MSFWSISDPGMETVRYGDISGVPLVIVHWNVSESKIDELRRAFGQDASAHEWGISLHDGSTPLGTDVYYFNASLELTERQAKVWAHEASHLRARRERLDPDPTHATDGGRLA